MPIAMPCPKCKAKLKGPDQLVGRTLKCPGCGTPVTITADAVLPAAPAPKPPESKAPAAPPAKSDSKADANFVPRMSLDDDLPATKEEKKPAPPSAPKGAAELPPGKKADDVAFPNLEIGDDVGFKDDPEPAAPSKPAPPAKKPVAPPKAAPPAAKNPVGDSASNLDFSDDVGFQDESEPAAPSKPAPPAKKPVAPPPKAAPPSKKPEPPSKKAKDAVPNMEIDDEEDDDEPYSDFETVDDDEEEAEVEDEEIEAEVEEEEVEAEVEEEEEEEVAEEMEEAEEEEDVVEAEVDEDAEETETPTNKAKGKQKALETRLESKAKERQKRIETQLENQAKAKLKAIEAELERKAKEKMKALEAELARKTQEKKKALEAELVRKAQEKKKALEAELARKTREKQKALDEQLASASKEEKPFEPQRESLPEEEVVDAEVEEEVVDAEMEEEVVEGQLEGEEEEEEVWVDAIEDEGESGDDQLEVVEEDDDVLDVVAADEGDQLDVVEEDDELDVVEAANADVSFRILQLPRLHVRSQSGMFAMTNAYDLVNPKSKKKVGEAVERPETSQQLLGMFVGKNMTTTKIEVFEGKNNLVMTVRRAPYFLEARAEIFDADDDKIGSFDILPFSALTGTPLWITDADDKQIIKLEMKLFSGRRYFRNKKGVLLAEWVHELTYEKKMIKFKLAPRGNSFYVLWKDGLDERPRDKLLILGASLGLDLFQTAGRQGVRFGR